MEIVEVDNRYRITIPKDVRHAFKVVKGQRFYLVPCGEDLLMRPLPKNPTARLDALIGGFEFGPEERRRTEDWLLKKGGT